MNHSSIKQITQYQKEHYEWEFNENTYPLDNYAFVLEKMGGKNKLKILDIGGGNGVFALSLKKYFKDKGSEIEIYVVDPVEYKAFEKHANEIHFIKDSAANLSKLFQQETFDLIFANNVFHHFVSGGWSTAIHGIGNVLLEAKKILKKDGLICITDFFYDGYDGFDTLPSRMIYRLTSCTTPVLAKIMKKMGAVSVGVGVCFLSKQKWFSLFSQSDLVVEMFQEGFVDKRNGIKKLYDICFCIKRCVVKNIMVVKKY